jgi:glutathione S-transferase
MALLTVFHIPVCPFCQRLEILLARKGLRDAVRFEVVDITRPRDPALLAKTRGTTALPVMELEDGRILKESLVILQYLEDRFPEAGVAQRDPWRRAVENMLTVLCNDLANLGYAMVMNQDRARQEDFRAKLLAVYARLDAFLVQHGEGPGPFLFEGFGWAEVVFTPMFMRLWFLDYYDGFQLPDEPRFARVRAWRDACLAHPDAQQTSKEEIVKLYYDYAKGAGNGALLPGRTRSSFAFEPHWSSRPWPPAAKYESSATDAELGLLP